jgi:predicted porin
MKKSLVALAVLAASGAAMAQSSVTLFGIVDAGYAVGNGSLTKLLCVTQATTLAVWVSAVLKTSAVA